MASRAAIASSSSKLACIAFVAATTAVVAYQNQETAIKCDAIPVQGVPGTNQERTFLAVKPDGVQRGLIGDIIARFEKRGYKVCAGGFISFQKSLPNSQC